MWELVWKAIGMVRDETFGETVDGWRTGGVSVALGLLVATAMVAGGVGSVAAEHRPTLDVTDQTNPPDESGNVTTLTVERAAAQEAFSLSVSGPNGTDYNTTRTYDPGTTLQDVALTLDPAVANDTTVTVRMRNASGVTLATETVRVRVLDSPGVAVSDQVRARTGAGAVYGITVDAATAPQSFYIDIRDSGTEYGRTQTFAANRTVEDIKLGLDVGLAVDTTLTVAVRNRSGATLAAETVNVTVANQTALTAGNPTGLIDEDAVDELRLAGATAPRDFYVDVHDASTEYNHTRIYQAGTELESVTLAIEPGISSDRNVTYAVHAADGTELLAREVAVNVVESATLNVSDQQYAPSDGAIDSMVVSEASSSEPFYIDVHGPAGEYNRTKTYPAGTTVSDLSLDLDPEPTENTTLMVALHTADGGEITATAARLSVVSPDQSTATPGEREATDTSTPTDTATATATDGGGSTGGDGPGFGALAAVVAALAGALVARRRR